VPSQRFVGRDRTCPSRMRKATATVYWLVPAKPERELFRDIIRILCKQFDAPKFEPHLTIHVSAKDRQSPKRILPQIKTAPIQLSVRGVGFSSQFTKTLYVRFKSSKLLEKLVVDLSRGTKSRAKSVRDLHVSLLYKKIPVRMKKELAATIKLPFREVIFDSIVAVRCALPTRGRTDVEAWKIVARKSWKE